MKRLFLAASAALVFCAPSFAQSSSWSIDPHHSSANFSIRHMMVSNVRGGFSKVSGTINYDGKDVTHAAVDAAIDTTTINTQEPNRDKHLSGPEFFDVAKYPLMTFKSKKITPAGEGRYKMIGDLTLHGVTKEVALNLDELSPQIKDKDGNLHMGASANGKINRKDFGISYGGVLDNGGAMIGDDVSLNIDVELLKKVAVTSSN